MHMTDKLPFIPGYERPDCRGLEVGPGGIFCVSDGTLDGFTPVTDDTFFD